MPTTQEFCKCGCYFAFHKFGVGECKNCPCMSFRPQASKDMPKSIAATVAETAKKTLTDSPLYAMGLMDRFEIPKGIIPGLVSEYIKHIEMDPTEETCQCIWEVHPDFVDVDVTKCAHCGHLEGEHFESGCYADDSTVIPDREWIRGTEREARPCNCKGFVKPKRLKRLKDTVDTCPVHTKEGLVLGFFEWIANNDRS